MSLNIKTRLRPVEPAPEVFKFKIVGFGNDGPTAIMCDRSDLSTLCRRLPLRTPAFYMLIGAHATTPILRPGETCDVEGRMRTHLHDAHLPWFDRALIVYGPAIDKSRALALQYFAHERLLKLGRCRLGSGADAESPARSVLTKSRPLYEQMRLLVGALGEDWFEAHDVATREEDDPLAPYEVPEDAERVAVFEKSAYRAAAALVDGDWVLLAGSEIRDRTQPSARRSDITTRAKLLRSGLLKPSPDHPGAIVLLCDLRVTSLDAAGKFIVGNRSSLTRFWRDVGEESPRRLPLF